MIRRGESGWVDVRRVLMVAWWWCERVAPQVSTGNRTRATIKALPSPLHHPRPYRKGISPRKDREEMVRFVEARLIAPSNRTCCLYYGVGVGVGVPLPFPVVVVKPLCWGTSPSSIQLV